MPPKTPVQHEKSSHEQTPDEVSGSFYLFDPALSDEEVLLSAMQGTLQYELTQRVTPERAVMAPSAASDGVHGQAVQQARELPPLRHTPPVAIVISDSEPSPPPPPPPPASTADQAPPRKQERPWQNKRKLSRMLGFTNPRDYDKWLDSDMFKPTWACFANGCLSHDNSGKRGVCLDRVRIEMRNGEFGGRGKYSAEEPDSQGWSNLDWQAWVLCRLVRVNSTNPKGIFYGKPSGEDERMENIWNVMVRETSNYRRERKKSK